MRYNKFIVLFAVLLIIGILSVSHNIIDLLQMPEFSFKYDIKNTVPLDSEDNKDYVLSNFTLRSEHPVKVCLITKSINTSYIDVKLKSSGGQEIPLLHGESYWTNRDVINFSQTLPKGEYEILLNSKKSPGIISCMVNTTQ